MAQSKQAARELAEVKKPRPFSQIRHGMTMQEIKALMGEPDDVNVGTRKYPKPLIYLYGEIELHFDEMNNGKVWLIHSNILEGVMEQLGNDRYKKYRRVAEDALLWLAERESQWGLERTINKRDFISALVERANPAITSHSGPVPEWAQNAINKAIKKAREC